MEKETLLAWAKTNSITSYYDRFEKGVWVYNFPFPFITKTVYAAFVKTEGSSDSTVRLLKDGGIEETVVISSIAELITKISE